MDHSLIRYLEDHSLNILRDALPEARAASGTSLQGVSDADLQVALYTVLLKIIDTLRERVVGPVIKQRDVRTMFRDSAQDIMTFIDGQSVYTTGHTAAVVNHVVRIASHLGLPDNEIDDLEYATWIHNIGLINQSQKLSTLPRALSQEELKQARNHTAVGADIIRPIEFLSHLSPTILYHHHRFDGGNAPNDPKGEDLPLGARIIAVADAYQAMVEPRAYRPAFDRRDAITEILKGSGTQFDPQLVQYAHQLS